MSQKVAPMTIKVAVVYQDPVLPSSNRIHEEFHWRNPRVLAASLVKHFREATDSVVNFQITEVVEATQLHTRLRGQFMTVDQYVALLKEPGWNTSEGRVGFRVARLRLPRMREVLSFRREEEPRRDR